MQNVPVVAEQYESVPVFPLPEFVMFPNTAGGLRAFESRYRLLAGDVIAGDRMMVLVGLKPGYAQADYYGSPATFKIGSLCQVINDERLEDGSYKLYVHCLARVSIEQVNRLTPYRLAHVRPVSDVEEDPEAVAQEMSYLRACVRGLALQIGEGHAKLGSILNSTSKPDILTNVIANHIAQEHDDRQELLEQTSVIARARKLSDIAEDLLLRSVKMGIGDDDGLIIN